MVAATERNVERRAEILEAAFALLTERGYDGTSMRAIAERTRASKETLYAWFGDKEGLFAALIAWQSEAMNVSLARVLDDPDAAPEAVLQRFGEGVVRLLLGPRSVAINRAAISEAVRGGAFGRLLIERGRKTTGTFVVRYLERQRAAGRLAFPDAERAFEVLLGLLLRDWQVRVLVGEMEPPPTETVPPHVREAIALFLRLYGTAGNGDGPGAGGGG